MMNKWEAINMASAFVILIVAAVTILSLIPQANTPTVEPIHISCKNPTYFEREVLNMSRSESPLCLRP